MCVDWNELPHGSVTDKRTDSDPAAIVPVACRNTLPPPPLPPAPAVRVEADDTRIVLHCRLLEHAGDAEVHYEASAQIIGEWGNADARASLLNAAAEAPQLDLPEGTPSQVLDPHAIDNDLPPGAVHQGFAARAEPLDPARRHRALPVRAEGRRVH